jgi:hypothetical protein
MPVQNVCCPHHACSHRAPPDQPDPESATSPETATSQPTRSTTDLDGPRRSLARTLLWTSGCRSASTPQWFRCDQHKGLRRPIANRPVDAAGGRPGSLRTKHTHRFRRDRLIDACDSGGSARHMAHPVIYRFLMLIPLSGRDRGAVREFSARPQILSGGQPLHLVWRILTGSQGK